MAETMFGLTFLSTFPPPPTEKTRMATLSFALSLQLFTSANESETTPSGSAWGAARFDILGLAFMILGLVLGVPIVVTYFETGLVPRLPTAIEMLEDAHRTEFAHSFIDIAAEAGFDAIKFQTHIADAESTRDEAFRVPFSYEDASRFDYWRRMEFTFSQWQGLADHARQRNLVFLSSCFSVDAVAMMRQIGMPWKVGSGEIHSDALIDAMASGGEPILLGFERRGGHWAPD
jgi:hypothetical protein